MVTKQWKRILCYFHSLILAKIHMVTKLKGQALTDDGRLILAKIHMVTKQD